MAFILLFFLFDWIALHIEVRRMSPTHQKERRKQGLDFGLAQYDVRLSMM